MNKLVKQAFTLIELLVVIAIIGILSGLIVVAMSGVTQKANIAKAQVFSNSLRNSLMLNIVGEWKIDEGSGTAANDTWGGINNGTLSGFADTTVGYGDTHTFGWMSSSNCISGTCLKFDGSDDYVYVSGSDSASSNFAITGAITLSAWVKFNASGTYGKILGRGALFNGDGNYGYFVGRHTNNLIYFNTHSTTTQDYFASSTVITDANWHLIVAIWDGTTSTNGKKIYIDGKLDNQKTSTISAMGQPSYLFKVGVDNNGSYYFNGLIDDVRIYNATIPTSQIKEQYYAGLNKLLDSGQVSLGEYQENILKLSQYSANK